MSLPDWLFADLFERIHFWFSSHSKQDTTAGSSAERPRNSLNQGHELASAYPRTWVRKAVLWLSLLHLSCEQADYIIVQSCHFGSDRRS